MTHARVGERMARSQPVTVMMAMMLALLLPIAAAAESEVVAGKPTVMVVLQEKVMGVFNTTGWEVPTQAELTLMERLRELGYPVVDPETVRRNTTQSQGLRILEADNQGAAAVGLQYGAAISIVGTAISKPAGAKLMGTQMQSIQATVTARVVENDTARVIASASSTAAKAHIDEVQGGALALEEAAQSLADELLPKMETALTVPEGAAQTLQISISGLKSYRHLDFILYHLEEKTPGVTAVYLDDFTNSVASLRIDAIDTTAVLGRKLAKKDFRGFRLEPMEVTQNTIHLSVIAEK